MKPFLIYIVESDADLAERLKNHLSSLPNTDIRICQDGPDCLRQLEDHPNLIILDYELNLKQANAEDGLHVLHHIKHFNHSIPVIMWSQQTHYNVALETIAKGAMHYVIRDDSSFDEIRDYVKMMMK